VAPYILSTELHSDASGAIKACLIVPDKADFLEDHFPNKPVFPATLLIYALTSMVIEKIQKSTSEHRIHNANISAIRRVKIRSWIKPGDQVSLRAVALPTQRSTIPLTITAYLGEKLVASALLEMIVKVSAQGY
jgi:3-hydroxymyristoyl/3-hydroxydecanoyl-(acyl carrier protein) dehydratase